MASGAGTQPSEPEGRSESASRLLLAGGLAGLLAGLIAAVLLLAGGSDEPRTVSAPPAECLRAWNRDEDALAFSRHNATFHEYESAQVGYMEPGSSAEVSSERGDGTCVVVFPRASLDPEPFAAGQVLLGRLWAPLDGLMPLDVIARVQSEAFEGANAQPTPEGSLEPLASD